jgi:tetratricopeptide (TPR) repeat protein
MPTIPEALATAIQHHQAGRLQAAEKIYRQILALDPAHAGAWHLLGLLTHHAGKQELAIEYIGYAIRLSPGVAAFHSNLGVVYRALGKLDEAAACWRRTLELNPDYVEALTNLGNVLREQGQVDQAVACYRRCLELKPDNPATYYNLGIALSDQGLLADAAACYRRALELKPDYTEAQNNLGVVLRRQGRLDEAAACYRRALELKPDYAEAHNNLGMVLKEQGKLDEVVACCRRALALKPDYAEAHLQQSFVSLLTGDFQRGWAEYQWRWKAKQFRRRDFSQPLWDGQPLEGRTILLHAEQGLGDSIQFVRYVPLVKRRGPVVILECPRPLLSLLASCAGIDRLVGQGDELPAFDVQAPLLSLPGIFRTSLETIPADVPYLFADPGKVERWRQELGGVAGFKIGIAWQGNPENPNDRDRSIPLGRFEPLTRCSAVRLLSLQKDWGLGQLQHVAERFPVTELGSRLQDFMDTAAVMMNLDLVITCETAVAHLAGALGVPVWIALPLVPDWRWLLDRSDSPWYPTMRLFRQESRGDWQGVFRTIEVALGQQISTRGLTAGSSPGTEDRRGRPRPGR